jgi:hypothetical protein
MAVSYDEAERLLHEWTPGTALRTTRGPSRP